MALPLGRLVLVVVALLWVTQPAAALTDASLDASLRTERGYPDEGSPIDCYEDSADRSDQPGPMPPSHSNGRNTSYFRIMWSEDPDYPNITAANRTDTNDTKLAAVETCRGDRAYSQPPDTTRWNTIEHQSYPADDADSWAAPSYVDPTSGGEDSINVNDANQ